MAENNPENFVRDPHDHDVLLGRGGLSNNHPGNNWYRRLVRSNKALYDQAKKHTKVLVSRAIVHHVQAQDPPGRFLERDTSTGLWIPASYDRAVHKTSQSLREKRSVRKVVNAQVAQPLKIPIAPVGGGFPREQAATVLTTAATTDAITAATAVVAQENAKSNTKLSQQRNEVGQRAENVAATAVTVAQENEQLDTKPPASSFSGRILSPTGPIRQQSSSRLRFRSKSKQGYSSNTIDYSSNDAIIIHSGFHESIEPNQFAPADASFLEASQSMEPVSLLNPLHQNVFDHDVIDSHSLELLPFNDKRHNENKRSRETFESSSPSDAPSLTRPTKQMADWLQSSSHMDDAINCQEEEEKQQGMQVVDQVSHQPQRSQGQKMQKQQDTHQTAAIASSSSSRSPPSSDLHVRLSVVAETVADLKQQQMQAQEIGADAAATIHEIQMQLGQMHSAIASSTHTRPSSTNVDAATTSAINNNVGPALPPPGTTLQPPVTSTLWNLASTPSRLFAGLSTFFSDSTGPSSNGEENDGGLRKMDGSLNTMGRHDMHFSGGITADRSGVMQSNLNVIAEDVGLDPLNPNAHQPPLEANNSAPLMPPPSYGTAQYAYGGNNNNNAELFNSTSEVLRVLDKEQDPQFGGKATGSLFDDVE